MRLESGQKDSPVLNFDLISVSGQFQVIATESQLWPREGWGVWAGQGAEFDVAAAEDKSSKLVLACDLVGQPASLDGQ